MFVFLLVNLYHFRRPGELEIPVGRGTEHFRINLTATRV